MGPMCRERNPCGAWHVRIKPKCTRVAVVGGFAIQVGAARLLSREKGSTPHVVAKPASTAAV